MSESIISNHRFISRQITRKINTLLQNNQYTSMYKVKIKEKQCKLQNVLA
jgi:hypothetical protein